LLKRPLVLLFWALLLGILAGHNLQNRLGPLAALAPIPFCLASALFLKAHWRFLTVSICFFLVGAFLDMAQHRPSSLKDMAEKGHLVRLQGMVLEETKREDDSQVFILGVSGIEAKGGWIDTQEKVQVVIKAFPQDLMAGDVIQLVGTLQPIRGFKTPGAMGSQKRNLIRGIYTRLTVPDGRYVVLLLPEGGLASIKRQFLAFLKTSLPQELYPLAAAILLGEKALVPKELRESFSKTGLNHVLVVSGLHIGLLMGTSLFGLRWLLLRARRFIRPDLAISIAVVSSAIVVVTYTELTGFQVSGSRAMFMSLIFLFSVFLFRATDAWTTLSFAGIMVLSVDPHNLFSLSFQLSFLSVVGILWGHKNIIKPFSAWLDQKENMRPFFKKTLHYCFSIFVLSLSTNLFLLPILLSAFNRFSIIGIFTNIICVPILGLLIVPFGILGLSLSLFSYKLAYLVFLPCTFVLWCTYN
jgi:competence protein ComEC